MDQDRPAFSGWLQHSLAFVQRNVIEVAFGSTDPVNAFQEGSSQPQLSSSESRKGQL